jgi:hypothetical protein
LDQEKIWQPWSRADFFESVFFFFAWKKVFSCSGKNFFKFLRKIPFSLLPQITTADHLNDSAKQGDPIGRFFCLLGDFFRPTGYFLLWAVLLKIAKALKNLGHFFPPY